MLTIRQTVPSFFHLFCYKHFKHITMTKHVLYNVKAFLILSSWMLLTGCPSSDDHTPVDPRDEFVGSYLVEEKCGSSTDSYVLQVEKIGNQNQMSVFNLFDFGAEQYASVNDNGQLKVYSTLPIGEDNDYCSLVITNVTGRVSGDRLSLNFVIEGRKGTSLLSFSRCDPYEVSCSLVGFR